MSAVKVTKEQLEQVKALFEREQGTVTMVAIILSRLGVIEMETPEDVEKFAASCIRAMFVEGRMPSRDVLLEDLHRAGYRIVRDDPKNS